MASGDLVGNPGQRRIIRTGVLKPVLCHCDRMSAAAPFANQTRSGLEAEAWRCANPTRGSQGLCYRLQLATRRLAEPAVPHFLKPVSESKDKEIATDPRRITVVQPAPFETQLLKSERTDAIELTLDRPYIRTGHG
jgi:hypothetical protein